VWGADSIDEIFEEVRWTLVGDAAAVKEALYGSTPVDHVFLGYSECKVIIPATRLTLALFATLTPGGTNSGGASGAVEIKAAGTGGMVGLSEYDNGLPLFVKPIVDGIAVANGKWLRLERTYPCPNFDVTFAATEGSQRVYGIEFKAHPDDTSKQLYSAGTVATGASY